MSGLHNWPIYSLKYYLCGCKKKIFNKQGFILLLRSVERCYSKDEITEVLNLGSMYVLSRVNCFHENHFIRTYFNRKKYDPNMTCKSDRDDDEWRYRLHLLGNIQNFEGYYPIVYKSSCRNLIFENALMK